MPLDRRTVGHRNTQQGKATQFAPLHDPKYNTIQYITPKQNDPQQRIRGPTGGPRRMCDHEISAHVSFVLARGATRGPIGGPTRER